MFMTNLISVFNIYIKISHNKNSVDCHDKFIEYNLRTNMIFITFNNNYWLIFC